MNNEDFATLGVLLFVSSFILLIIGIWSYLCAILGTVAWLGAMGCFLTALIIKDA